MYSDGSVVDCGTAGAWYRETPDAQCLN